MQIRQGAKSNTRLTQAHAGAGNRVEHPGGCGNNNAFAKLYIKSISIRVASAMKPPQLATETRMPVIMDDSVVDMGRMNGNWPWAGRTIYSWGPRAAANQLLSPIR